MKFFNKFFGFGCAPTNDAANYTLAYVANMPENPQIFTSTAIEVPMNKENNDLTMTIEVPRNKDIKKVPKFISRRINENSECKQMYMVLQECLNDRVSRHILLIMKAPRELQSVYEIQLKDNYISMIREPEWEIKMSSRIEVLDHPHFAEFNKCQLQCDFLYHNNSHEMFMRMHYYLMRLMHQICGKTSAIYIMLLKAMTKRFDEYVARDLLVLYFYTEKKEKTTNMEEYLMAKYWIGKPKTSQLNEKKAISKANDFDIKTHPYFKEYFTSKIELEQNYPFKFFQHYDSINKVAENWIEHRRKTTIGPIPETIEAMYVTLEQNLTLHRAYDLFILSQYRMDFSKVKRMEAYLSEKYRPYFPRCILDQVVDKYENVVDVSFFGTKYPAIKKAIDYSNLMHPTYSKVMIDEVCKMLVTKQEELLPFANPTKTLRKEKKLLNFLYNRPNESRIRELYAMIYCDISNWEGAFYDKYRMDIKLLKNFHVVENFSIW